jgi:hypothetical protein
MTPENKSAAIAALIIMLVFGFGLYFMPTIMLAIGNYSTTAAGIVAVLFVAAFFGVFWLRGRSQRGK